MADIYSKILIFAVIVSIFGFSLVFLLATTPQLSDNFPLRKPLVGSIFSLICISGTVAAFYPKQCSKISHFKEEKPDTLSSKQSSEIKGHHPTCGNFSAHVMSFNNHTICAACVGLAIGALIALIGTFLYFYLGVCIFNMGFVTIIIGVVGLVFGFLQLRFKGIARLALNILFVFSAFLVLIGIDELAESLVADLFVIMIISFWLFTRILLSKWDHSQICKKCTPKCEIAG